jgi:hypothetical protein
MKPEFGQPTPEAKDYVNAITAAIEATSKTHVAAGKQTMFMDPMSALLGVLGSFIAGSPEFVRNDVLEKCDRLLRIAVQQSLDMDTGQNVYVGRKQ